MAGGYPGRLSPGEGEPAEAPFHQLGDQRQGPDKAKGTPPPATTTTRTAERSAMTHLLDTTAQCLAVLRDLAARPPAEREPIGTSLEYERWVEAPRRRGVDPVWQAMLNEALGENEPTIRKAG